MSGTAIAGPDALTRAVTTSKVKKIAKKQAVKQIKQKAILGPGRVVTASVRPNILPPDGYVPVFEVPGFLEFRVDCGDSQQNWDLNNRSGRTMHFTGSITFPNQIITDEQNVDNGDSFGLIGGNFGNYEVTIHATSPTKSFSFNAVALGITGTECPWSIQAIVTGK